MMTAMCRGKLVRSDGDDAVMKETSFYMIVCRKDAKSAKKSG